MPRAQWLNGWPESWYEGGNKRAYALQCPVSGCNEVFKTAQELQNHADTDQTTNDQNFNFYHMVLKAMIHETVCPQCGEKFAQGIMGFRLLAKHDRDGHRVPGQPHSKDFEDIKKFIGLIRKYRFEGLGGSGSVQGLVQLWSFLHQYYRRNIRKQDEFEDFKAYLVGFELLGKALVDVRVANGDGEGDYVDQIASMGRDKDFPDFVPRETCEKVYPVDPEAFLSGFPRPEIGTYLEIMREKYAAGDF